MQTADITGAAVSYIPMVLNRFLMLMMTVTAQTVTTNASMIRFIIRSFSSCVMTGFFCFSLITKTYPFRLPSLQSANRPTTDFPSGYRPRCVT